MNPVKRVMSWLRGSTGPESAVSVVEAQRLADDRDTIRISQNTATSQFGIPSNLSPTPDMLDPGSEDSHKYR